MKISRKILLVVLFAALIMSGCKVKEFTPPAEEPVVIDTPAVVVTEPEEEAPVDLAPVVIDEATLFDENGKMVCNVVPGFLSGDSEEKLRVYDLIGPVTDEDAVLGPEDAKLTIIEYSDFQCPYCAQTYAVLDELIKNYPDDVRLVFRHLPLSSIHPNANLASQATEAAGLQGKFWEMYAILFEEQASWSSLSTEDFTTWLAAQADTLEMDATQFTTDLTSEAVVTKVSDSYTKATSVGLSSTPTLFVNGNYMGNLGYSTLEGLLSVYDFESEMFTECPDWLIDMDKSYTATIETEKGDVVVELFADKAPLAVNSFVFLAREGYFDDISFHRVMYDFVAQSGDPTGTGLSNPGYQFKNEIVEGLNFDVPGILGMANAGADTNGSQFFITYVGTPNLNGSYTVFGEVIEGMDVLKEITERDPQTNPDAPEGDKIITISIVEK